MGIVTCLRAEGDVWDTLLTETYEELHAKLVSEGGTAPSATSEELTTALSDAQRAWTTLRDADCDLQFRRHQAGTIRSVVHAGCLMTKTASRALELRDMLSE